MWYIRRFFRLFSRGRSIHLPPPTPHPHPHPTPTPTPIPTPTPTPTPTPSPHPRSYIFSTYAGYLKNWRQLPFNKRTCHSLARADFSAVFYTLLGIYEMADGNGPHASGNWCKTRFLEYLKYLQNRMSYDYFIPMSTTEITFRLRDQDCCIIYRHMQNNN